MKSTRKQRDDIVDIILHLLQPELPPESRRCGGVRGLEGGGHHISRVTSHVSRSRVSVTCLGLVTASIFHLPASILGQVKLSEGWRQRHAQFNAR